MASLVGSLFHRMRCSPQPPTTIKQSPRRVATKVEYRAVGISRVACHSFNERLYTWMDFVALPVASYPPMASSRPQTVAQVELKYGVGAISHHTLGCSEAAGFFGDWQDWSRSGIEQVSTERTGFMS